MPLKLNVSGGKAPQMTKETKDLKSIIKRNASAAVLSIRGGESGIKDGYKD